MQTQNRITRNSPMEDRVLSFMQAHPQPITSAELIERMPGCPISEKVRGAIQLLRSHELITQTELKIPGARLVVIYELTERGKTHQGPVRLSRPAATYANRRTSRS